VDEAGEDTARDLAEATTASGIAPDLRPLSYTRGLNVRAAVSWVRKNHGDDGKKLLARALPSEVLRDVGGERFEPPSMQWVPFHSHATVLETIDAVFGIGDLALCRDVGKHMAHHDFPTLARPVARLLTPAVFVSMSTKIWRLYNSHGAWEIVHGDREIKAVLLKRPEHHSAFCVGVLGWIEGALEISGAIDAHADEERCAAKGAPVCSIHVTWKEKNDGARNRVPRPPS
jgi:hypothetical protein